MQDQLIFLLTLDGFIVVLGPVGRTFAPESPLEGMGDPFALAMSSNPRGVTPLGLNENSDVFADSKWCYDTPGVVHPDQVCQVKRAVIIIIII